MLSRKNVFVSLALAAVAAACSTTDSATAPQSSNEGDMFATTTGGPTTNATIRIRCELRVGQYSKISVDGNNLSPQNAMYASGVRSGGVTVTHQPLQAVGDEVEFDYSSQPNDIAAGAQSIPANYIVVNPNGPDVLAAITLPNGTRVVTGGADCLVR